MASEGGYGVKDAGNLIARDAIGHRDV